MRRAALFLILFTVSAAAQHRESVTVEVIDVPVYVVRGTEPVRGLTRDDFELFVNGKRTPIEYFDVVGDAPPAETRGGTPAVRRERRLFVLLFDLAFTRSYMIRRAQLGAIKLLDQAEPLDAFAVATYAPDGLRYTLPFTRDRNAVKTALQQLTSRATYDPLSLVPVAVATTREELVPNEPADPDAEPEPGWTEAHSQSVTSDPGKEAMITPEGTARGQKASGGNIVIGNLRGLTALATNLARIEGQKHVVMISEGFDITALNDYRSMTPGGPDLYMAMQLDEVFRAYQSAGVFLHTLDPAGLRGIKEWIGTPALGILASGTGGQAMNDRNDLHLALADLKNAHSYGYVLGFRPRETQKGENRIAVKVKRGGVRVTHRRGFAPDGGARPMNGLYLADIVLNDVPQTGLVPVMEVAKGYVRARLPMKAIAAQLGEKKDDAELLVYLFDLNGQPIDFRRHAIAVTDKDVEVVDLGMGLRPGAYVLKTLLRVGDSLGFTRANLRVGAPAAGGS
jgi:VWFA-related protein